MSRTRIVLRHDPAAVAGLITHRRRGRRTLRGLCREVARKFNGARGLTAHHPPLLSHWVRGDVPSIPLGQKGNPPRSPSVEGGRRVFALAPERLLVSG